MVTKTITITEEAYNFLKGMKSEKSFSETILSLRKNQHVDYSQFIGFLSVESAESIHEVHDQFRKDTDERMKRLYGGR